MEEIQDYLNNNNLGDSYTVTALDGKGKVQLKREDNADDITPAQANEMAWVNLTKSITAVIDRNTKDILNIDI